MKSEALEARKIAAPIRLEGSPHRPAGVRDRTMASNFKKSQEKGMVLIILGLTKGKQNSTVPFFPF